MQSTITLLSLLVSTTSAVSTLMRFGCDGNIDFGEETLVGPLNLKWNGADKLIKFYESELKAAATDKECGCPDITQEQVNKFFTSWHPSFLFNLVRGFEAESVGPLRNCNNVESLPKQTLPKFELPSTCTAERWNRGDGCQLGLKRTAGDMRLVVRMEKCAGRELPFFELGCEGKDCATLIAPCSHDSDCTGGTDMSCMELFSIADECAVEKCVNGGRTQIEPVSAGQCVGGSYAPAVAGTGCQLGSEKFGVGFEYWVDKMDLERTKVPKSAADIQQCVRKTCSASGSWEETMAQSFECFNALVRRADATGNQCPGSGSLEANTFWPFNSRNTCNWGEIEDQMRYGLAAPEPFGFGSQRVVSNAREMLGSFFGYDDVDYLKNPFGCRRSSASIHQLAQLARNIVDRNAQKTPVTMKQTGQLGLCLPGRGYTLEKEERSNDPQNFDWDRYSPKVAAMDDPLKVINDHFGLNCTLSCVGGDSGSGSGSGGSGSGSNTGNRVFTDSGVACDQTTFADFVSQCSQAQTTCEQGKTAQSEKCPCMDAYINCLSGGESEVCSELVQTVKSTASYYKLICEKQGLGSSGSRSEGPWGSGNCTATCGKDKFAFSAPKYGDDKKFDGASMRKVPTVQPITPIAKHVLGHVNCIGQVKLLPNHPMVGAEISATGFLELLSGFRQEHKAAYNCRAEAHGGKPLSQVQYDVRSFTLSNVIYFMTTPVSTQVTDLGVTFRDLRTRLFGSTAGRLEMPSTCTFDFWNKNGQCRLSFSGFSQPEVFGANADINMMLSVCPGTFIPEAYAECVGEGCDFFNGPQPCATKNDCSLKGFVCHALEELGRSSGSGSPGQTQFSKTLQTPQQAMSSTSSFDVEVVSQQGQPMTAAFKFVTSADLTNKNLKVEVRLPGGVTDNKKVLLFEGPYTNRFYKAEVRANGENGGPTCPDEHHVEQILYEPNQIFLQSTCSCLLANDRRRSIVGPQPMQLSHLLKRQSSGSSSSTDNTALLIAGQAVFQNKPQCGERALNQLVPKLMSLISGVPFDANKKGVCFVDFETRNARGQTALETWADDQVQIDGSVVKLKYLSAWMENKVKVTPIDDGVTIRDTFGKEPWLEKEGAFCFDCPDGVNTDVGVTDEKGTDGAVSVATSMAVVALSVFVTLTM